MVVVDNIARRSVPSESSEFISPDRASDGMGNDPEFPTVGFVVRLES